MQTSRATHIRRVALAVGLVIAVIAAVAPVLLLKPPPLDARGALTIWSASLAGDDSLTDAQVRRAQQRVHLAEETTDDAGLVRSVWAAQDEQGCWALLVIDGTPATSAQLTDPALCETAPPTTVAD